MHTVQVAVPLAELTKPVGWLGSMVEVVRELKAKGVPVVGTTGIRAVEWGTLSQFSHSLDGEQLYTFRWQGERLKDNSEKELI